jgi:hypothetical protein
MSFASQVISAGYLEIDGLVSDYFSELLACNTGLQDSLWRERVLIICKVETKPTKRE